MAFGIYILPIIGIMIKVLTSENAISDEKLTCEAQLQEVNENLLALETSINGSFPKIMDTLKDVKNKVEALKGDFFGQFFCERNKSSVYTVHDTLMNQTNAKLSCQANGSHLVSIENMHELNYISELIQTVFDA